MEDTSKNIRIFDYLNYRDFLRDYYDMKKQQGRGFSLRQFAKIAGLGSPGYLKMVIEGERNLRPKTIHQFIQALRLNGKEAKYFENLVLFNQAKDEKEKDLYFQRLTEMYPRTQFTELEKDQYEFLSDASYVTIHQMMTLKDFDDDIEWIAKRIYPHRRPGEIKKAIQVLERLGLVGLDETGKHEPKDVTIRTPAEVPGLDVLKYHRGMLNDAKTAMTVFPASACDITALTIPLPRKALPKFKKKIEEFRESLMEWISSEYQEFDEVYQLNLQLFPVTWKRKKQSNGEG